MPAPPGPRDRCDLLVAEAEAVDPAESLIEAGKEADVALQRLGRQEAHQPDNIERCTGDLRIEVQVVVDRAISEMEVVALGEDVRW